MQFVVMQAKKALSNIMLENISHRGQKRTFPLCISIIMLFCKCFMRLWNKQDLGTKYVPP